MCTVVLICTYSFINAQDHNFQLSPQPQDLRITQAHFVPDDAYQLTVNKVEGADTTFRWLSPSFITGKDHIQNSTANPLLIYEIVRAQ